MRRVVAGCAGDAAAGMRTGTAEIKTRNRHAVVRMAHHGAQRKQLVERQGAMENVAVHKAETLLQIQWRQHLPRDNGRLEIRCVPRDGVDDDIGKRFLFPLIGP